MSEHKKLVKSRDAARLMGIAYNSLRDKKQAGEITPRIDGGGAPKPDWYHIDDLDIAPFIRPGAWDKEFNTYYQSKLITNVQKRKDNGNQYVLTLEDGSKATVSKQETLLRVIEVE